MKNDYIVLAATYGKLKNILKVPEPTRRQQSSMCHAYPPIIPLDDTEVLVLLDKNNQRVVLSLGPTFEAEEVDIGKLSLLPVYGGEYTVTHSAFHGLTIERGIRSADRPFGSPLQQPMMPQFNPMGVPPLHIARNVHPFQPGGLSQYPAMGAHARFQNLLQHADTNALLVTSSRHAVEERKLARQKFLDKIFDNLIAKGKSVDREKFDESASATFHGCDLLIETETGDIALIKPDMGILSYYYDLEAQFFVPSISSGRFE